MNVLFTGAIHPAALLFPMLGDEEMKALADDIAANGLQHPIVLDADGTLVDGRNRLRACEIAGVEPTFTTTESSDVLALVVSLNVKRRNLTAAQRAMAAAEAWPMYEVATGAAAHGKSSRSGTTKGDRTDAVLAEKFTVGRNLIAQARSVLNEAPSLAADVKNGTTALADAYAAVQALKTAADEADRRRLVIADRAPELAEAVLGGALSTDDAWQKLQQAEADEMRVRHQAEAERIERAKRLSSNLAEHVRWCAEILATDGARRDVIDHFDQTIVNVPFTITAEAITAAAENLLALAKEWT